MARYYFHLYNDIHTHDDVGAEYSDESEAKSYATHAARDIAGAHVKDGRLNLAHFIEVTDKQDHPIFRVVFRDVIEILDEPD